MGFLDTLGTNKTSSDTGFINGLGKTSVSTQPPQQTKGSAGQSLNAGQGNFADQIWSMLSTYGGSVKNTATEGVNQVKQAATDIQTPSNENPIVRGVEKGLAAESGLASIVSSPLAPLFKPITMAVNAVGDKVSDIPAVQKFASSNAGQTTSRIAEDLSNAGNVAGTILGVDQAVKVAPTIVKNTIDTAASIKNTVSEIPTSVRNKVQSTPEKIDASIVDSYNKAVKPTTAGKTTAGQFEAYQKNVASGIKSIARNKDALTFETDLGTEAGRTPQTRGELADAVAQTKSSLFKQYDALAQQAGEQGIKIPVDNAGSALDDVISSEALKIANPSAIKYAQDIQERLKNPDGTYKQIDPQVTQDVIKNYNETLKAFYKNPTYDTASRAAIDAGIVHELRKALDEAINNATGENYQELKSQYGALSALEKDVNKAALQQAKQVGSNTMGLGKYVDVFSGGDMVSGLLSLNPALFTKGLAQSGISHFFQWLNSPDRAVSTMFKNASNIEKLK